MNADVFFLMGSTHKICQDYALCHSHETKPYVLLSDGCSSAPHTDFGSRILAKSAERYLRVDYSGNISSYLINAILSAQGVSAGLQLPTNSLCATLLTAKVDGDDFQTIIVGDGVVAGKKIDGSVVVEEYTFESGAPYYLRYELEDETKNGYFAEFGTNGNHYRYIITPDGEIEGDENLSFAFNKNNIYFENRFPLSEFESVTLFSDGALSFLKHTDSGTSRQNFPVPGHTVVKEFTSFKGYVGEFVQRRAQRGIKTLLDQGMRNSDDLSIASLAKEKK